MMTIKDFASLCGCTTQTLRYYDRIGLLKPVRVAPDSGYRYYDRQQALDFVRIKNLQAADFTIDEIRPLLTQSDRQVYEAFERKIAEQAEKLERIRKIQKSYLTEKSNMEKLVKSVTDYVFHSLTDHSIMREFGLSPEEAPAAMQRLREYLEAQTTQHLPDEADVQLVVNDRTVRGAEQVAEVLNSIRDEGLPETMLLGDGDVRASVEFTPENSRCVWSRSGWQFVYEFLDDIPALEQGYGYCFFFELAGEKYRESPEFALTMISAMLPRAGAGQIAMGCRVERSPDEENHFALLRKRATETE